ncbi:MAG: hypothetical protein RR550_01005 [Rikenellaceae bacterium]
MRLAAASLPTVLIVATLMLLTVMGLFSIWDRNNNTIGYELYRTQQLLDLESAVTIYCIDTTVKTDVKREIEPYGLYEKITVTTANGNFSKQAIVGAPQDSTVLYVTDNGRPLSLTGATNIEGVTYLPKFGVAYNQMGSHFFTGKKLEQIRISDDKLPEIIEIDTIREGKIIVESGFRGERQIFATDTVIIEENVIMKYPSGIYVKNGYVEIRDSSQVNGYVIVTGRYKQFPTAKVRGTLYVDGIAQLQGIISGKIYAKECTYYSPEGIYTNTIYNLTAIENHEIASPILIKNVQHHERRIIKWLYD